MSFAQFTGGVDEVPMLFDPRLVACEVRHVLRLVHGLGTCEDHDRRDMACVVLPRTLGRQSDL